MGNPASIPLMGVAPQTPNPIEAYARIMGIKAMQQEQQTRELQQQGLGQENQLRQIQIQDQQGMRNAYIDAQGDPDKFLANVKDSKYGVSFNGIMSANQGMLEMRQKMLGFTNDQLAQHEKIADLYNGFIKQVKDAPSTQRPQVWQQGSQQFQGLPGVQLPARYPGDDNLDMMGYQGVTLSKAIDNAKAQAETSKDTAQASRDTAEAAKTNTQMNWYKGHGGLPPGITPEMAQYADYLQKGGNPSGWAGYKAQQEAAATQPYKIGQAVAEAKAKQLLEGVVKPGYGFDQNGNRVLMSQTQALQSGVKNWLPVTEKELGDDIHLNNRLADVQQKIARYQQALQAPISAKEKGNIAALIDSQEFKAGAFGTELPVNRLNAALQRENLQDLSPAARDLMIAYYNARESMVGYNQVLSGSGRSNETNLHLQLQTLPDPAVTDQDYSNRSLGQFRENLKIVGQGLPVIPGIKRPEEWEKSISGPQVNIPPSLAGQAQPAAQSAPKNTPPPAKFSLGQRVSIKGKQMRVTKVYPDGTFDAQ